MKIVLALAAIGFASLVTACTSSDTTGRFSQALSGPPAGECGEIETHVLGVWGTPNGTGTIYLDRKGKHVLVLSAHEKTNWIVKTASDARLEHVYITGFHEQTVDLSGAAGTPNIIRDSMDTNGTGACGFSWPYDGGECDTDGLLTLASARTNMAINSFAGCYTASTFHINSDMAATSDCEGQTVGGQTKDAFAHFFSCDAADTDGDCGGGSDGEGAGGGGSPENGGGPVLL